MKNLTTVIAQLESAGLPFEVHYPQSFVKYRWDNDTINLNNSDTVENAQIGIEVQAHVWAWFTYNPSFNYFSFDHRYNRNTGGTIKAWNTGYNISLKLKEKYNIELR